MGQAKNRGTPEQRRAEAEQREKAVVAARKEHLAKLDKLHEESEQMANAATRQMIAAHLKYSEKESLTRKHRERTVAAS